MQNDDITRHGLGTTFTRRITLQQTKHMESQATPIINAVNHQPTPYRTETQDTLLLPLGTRSTFLAHALAARHFAGDLLGAAVPAAGRVPVRRGLLHRVDGVRLGLLARLLPRVTARQGADGALYPTI